MTGNLTLSGRILPEDAHFPDVCPKCGAALGSDPRFSVPEHFRRQHPRSIGLAFWRNDQRPVEFAYIAPVPGLTRRTWYTVVFSLPFDLFKLRPDEWRVEWTVGNGPTEGVFS